LAGPYGKRSADPQFEGEDCEKETKEVCKQVSARF
jgi:hypothetical protein